MDKKKINEEFLKIAFPPKKKRPLLFDSTIYTILPKRISYQFKRKWTRDKKGQIKLYSWWRYSIPLTKREKDIFGGVKVYLVTEEFLKLIVEWFGSIIKPEIHTIEAEILEKIRKALDEGKKIDDEIDRQFEEKHKEVEK